MARDLKFVIQTRAHGEPWRTAWSGPGEGIAINAARRLAEETRLVEGFGVKALPVHAYVRVTQGKRVVYDITPDNRQSDVHR